MIVQFRGFVVTHFNNLHTIGVDVDDCSTRVLLSHISTISTFLLDTLLIFLFYHLLSSQEKPSTIVVSLKVLVL
jgi:hypothetical protein